ncbi:MAG: DEAD/DEAH box helicase family protein [Merdibacter sp.]
MEERTCLRCGNADPEYFWNDEGVWYCRRCIAFGRIDAGQRPIPPKWEKRVIHCEYHLKYPLTTAQKRTVDEVMEGLNGGHDVLIYAATGAGKTELTMEAIRQYFARGKRVGFAIARRRSCSRSQSACTAFPDLGEAAGHTDRSMPISSYARCISCTAIRIVSICSSWMRWMRFLIGAMTC